MMQIPLTRGLVAIVDDDDYERLRQWRWHAKPNADCRYFAAVRCVQYRGRRISYPIANAILGLPPEVLVDHANRDALDNRKRNLRRASDSLNSVNWLRTNKWGFRGVSQHARRWRASITVDGVRRRLGSYLTVRDAALAYDYEARRLHGIFAQLNFPLVITGKPHAIEWRPGKAVFRGVFPKRGKWSAKINEGSRQIYLGVFVTPEEAAQAYDEAARKIHGNRAVLNFPG